MIKKLFFVLPLFLTLTIYSQDFYITSAVNVPLGNQSFKLNVINCSTPGIFICPPTNNIGQYPENQYGDIAVDNNQNLYYVSGWGSLYKRNLNDTSSCQFLGTFNNSNSINALVSDSAGELYAAGNFGGVCTLYKYNSGDFKTLGNLPPTFFSAGDLFFYEHRLFLTGTNSDFSSSFLVEINLTNPQLSCYYMGLQNFQPFGAFSIRNGSTSEAYILCTTSSISSSLRKIDISNRSVSDTICNYPFLIAGAATYYDLTTSNSSCVVTAVNTLNQTADYFLVQNPSSALIRTKTNIDQLNISSLVLFDISGRFIKNYSVHDFPKNLDVENIPSGIYILQLTTKNKRIITQKVLRLN